MIFPFSIKYSQRLKNGPPANVGTVMHYIEDFIEKRNGEHIRVNENELTYKTRLFGPRLRSSILASVDEGKFTLRADGHLLTYQFCIYRLFIIVSMMSIIMVVVSGQVLAGALCFGWLGGMNWIIAIIRHRMMLNNIVKGIDNLIEGQDSASIVF